MASEITLKRLIVFSILMAKGRGVVTKHPEFIRDTYFKILSENEPVNLLLGEDRKEYDKYITKWSGKV